jgi:hypothetical protein
VNKIGNYLSLLLAIVGPHVAYARMLEAPPAPLPIRVFDKEDNAQYTVEGVIVMQMIDYPFRGSFTRGTFVETQEQSDLVTQLWARFDLDAASEALRGQQLSHPNALRSLFTYAVVGSALNFTSPRVDRYFAQLKWNPELKKDPLMEAWVDYSAAYHLSHRQPDRTEPEMNKVVARWEKKYPWIAMKAECRIDAQLRAKGRTANEVAFAKSFLTKFKQYSRWQEYGTVEYNYLYPEG